MHVAFEREYDFAYPNLGGGLGQLDPTPQSANAPHVSKPIQLAHNFGEMIRRDAIKLGNLLGGSSLGKTRQVHQRSQSIVGMQG
jgi:hypothetical protein